jgi:D-methionine transport system ATP-binding protein
MKEKETLIEIKNVSKSFYSASKATSVNALKEVNLAIRSGCIYGIIGTSGAGKSTLLRCLTGLEKPSQGTITFGGVDFSYDHPQSLRELRRQLGMVFQHFHLFSSRTVADNVSYPLEIAGLPASDRQSRVDELLHLVGLKSKQWHYPAQLSGGEKQRVGIARALAPHPRLLLCDEPTSALDAKTTRDLLHLLNQLNVQLGLTIVIITHQLEVAKQICHRVAVLSHGQIVEEGDIQQIFTHPKHLVTKHLLRLSPDQLSPDLLEPQMGKYLVRLGFEGHQTKQPILSQMLKRYEVDANILSGGLDYLQQTVVGHLLIELSGSAEAVDQALTFLRNQHVTCEVIR